MATLIHSMHTCTCLLLVVVGVYIHIQCILYIGVLAIYSRLVTVKVIVVSRSISVNVCDVQNTLL